MANVADEVSALAQIRNRRLYLQDRKRFDDLVGQLDDRYDYELTVRRLYANRSQQQNKFYWAVVVELLSEHTGYTADETHEILKMQFIPKRLALADDNGDVKGEFVIGGSTRKMSTSDFGKYIESIREWAAAELGVIIPDPDGYVTAAGSAHGSGWGV